MSLQFHTFIDYTESVEFSNEHLVSYITLGKNYIHYSVMDTKQQICLLTKAIYNVKGIIGQSEFDTLLADNALRNSSVVHIAVDTAKHTLVPTSMLSPDHFESYFSPLYELETEEIINAQSIDPEITQLYVVRKASLQYLKNEFREARIYSNTACLLHSYLKIVTSVEEQNPVFIHTSFGSMVITLFTKKQLLYMQSVEISGESDVLYCLLNVLQLHQIEVHNTTIFLTGFSDRQNAIASLLATYIHVETIEIDRIQNENQGLQHFPLPILFNQYSLISCAS
ncbi:MAG: DUF3822 family protein [Bacteroidetes bacterium]|nr:DUF3822 family protein [Bacteroidota bacterium]